MARGREEDGGREGIIGLPIVVLYCITRRGLKWTLLVPCITRSGCVDTSSTLHTQGGFGVDSSCSPT